MTDGGGTRLQERDEFPLPGDQVCRLFRRRLAFSLHDSPLLCVEADAGQGIEQVYDRFFEFYLAQEMPLLVEFHLSP